MSATVRYHERDDRRVEDGIVTLHDISWDDYERLLAMRGDRSAPRISYLKGAVEILSQSQTHAAVKSAIGRMVELYCMERGIRFSTFGSWTLKDPREKRGAEPDECWIFGGPSGAPRPHLVVEVEWTSGRIDKLEIYRKLGVAEVWYWRRGRIQPYALRGERYVPIAGSEVLPGIDLERLTACLDEPTTYDALRAFRETLDAQGPQPQ